MLAGEVTLKGTVAHAVTAPFAAAMASMWYRRR